MASPAPRRMTVAEFLGWDDGTDTRYELVHGQPVAMAPPVEDHGTIVMNLGRRIGDRLVPPCRVLDQAGIALPGRDDAWYQADLAVTRAPPERGRRHVAEPVLIVEVLSPSTTQRDRGTKLPDYRDLPSVREILLVSSTERRVELWRRDGPRWIVESLVGEAELRLEAIDAAIPLAAVYENVAV